MQSIKSTTARCADATAIPMIDISDVLYQEFMTLVTPAVVAVHLLGS